MIYKYLYLKAYKNIIYILASLPAILSFDGEACCELSRVLFAHWITTGQEHFERMGHQSWFTNPQNNIQRGVDWVGLLIFELEIDHVPKKDFLENAYLMDTCSSVCFVYAWDVCQEHFKTWLATTICILTGGVHFPATARNEWILSTGTILCFFNDNCQKKRLYLVSSWANMRAVHS